MIRKMKVPHVGLLLKEEVIDTRGLSVTNAAKMLGISRPALSNVLNGKAGVSADLALRISTVFGGSPDIWVRMQAAYDLDMAKSKFNKVGLKPYLEVA